jgi:hypothetical protein
MQSCGGGQSCGEGRMGRAGEANHCGPYRIFSFNGLGCHPLFGIANRKSIGDLPHPGPSLEKQTRNACQMLGRKDSLQTVLKVGRGRMMMLRVGLSTLCKVRVFFQNTRDAWSRSVGRRPAADILNGYTSLVVDHLHFPSISFPRPSRGNACASYT